MKISIFHWTIYIVLFFVLNRIFHTHGYRACLLAYEDHSYLNRLFIKNEQESHRCNTEKHIRKNGSYSFTDDPLTTK